MNFRNLEYFRTVARLGNMSRAAEELYISQPGLSRYITRLEDEVGAPLFERRKGRIVLNAYGQMFLTSVNQAFEILDRGADNVLRVYNQNQNILSVACSIEDFLADRLKEFSSEKPGIGIRQFSYSIVEIEAHLLKQNLDVAVCAHKPNNDKLVYETLSRCPYVLVSHRENPLAQNAAVELAQTEGCNYITENSRLSRILLEDVCREHSFSPKVSHEVESGYILFNLLEGRAGIALIPMAQFMKINKHFPGHHLQAIRLIDSLPMSEIGVCHLPEQYLNASAKVFISFLRQWAHIENEELEKMLNTL